MLVTRQVPQSWLGLYSGNYTDNYKENSLLGGFNGKKTKFGSINSILNTRHKTQHYSASSGVSNFSSSGSVRLFTLYNLSRHDPQATFYDLVGPTFQLVTALLLSLGSEKRTGDCPISPWIAMNYWLSRCCEKMCWHAALQSKTSRLGRGLSDDIEAITGPPSASSGTKSSSFGEYHGNNDYKNVKEDGVVVGDGDAELGIWV